MAVAETGRRPKTEATHLEVQKIGIADLELLVERSIGTAFLSSTSYDEIVGNEGRNFKPWQFDPIRIVRVQTHQGIQILIQDGHHRAKAFLDIAKKYPKTLKEILSAYEQNKPEQKKWQPPILDVTENYLDSPAAQGEQAKISMRKYLEILAPHTKKQAKVLTQRTGLYTMNYWANIAPPAFAERLPAYAALALLNTPELKVDSQTEFTNKLKATKLFDDETTKQRDQQIQALITLKDFLKELEMPPSTVLTFARELISDQSLLIGGAKEAKKHFAGLASLPQVEQKREIASDRDKRINLQQSLSSAFSRLPATLSTRQNYLEAIQKAIEDPHLSLREVNDVVQATSPSKEYNDLLAAKQLEKRKEEYREQFSLDRDFTTRELNLLAKNVPLYLVQDANVIAEQADKTLPLSLSQEQANEIQQVSRWIFVRPANQVAANIKKLKDLLNPPEKDNETKEDQPMSSQLTGAEIIRQSLEAKIAELATVNAKQAKEIEDLKRIIKGLQDQLDNADEKPTTGSTKPQPEVKIGKPLAVLADNQPPTTDPTIVFQNQKPEKKLEEDPNEDTTDGPKIPKLWYKLPLTRKLTTKELEFAKAVANEKFDTVSKFYSVTEDEVRRTVDELIRSRYLPTLTETDERPRQRFTLADVINYSDRELNAHLKTTDIPIPGWYKACPPEFLTEEELACLKAVETNEIEAWSERSGLTKPRIRTIAKNAYKRYRNS